MLLYQWCTVKQVLHVCPSASSSARNNTGLIKRIFTAFDMSIFRKSVKKIQFPLKSDKNDGYITWRPIRFFFITSLSFLVRMRNVSDKSCTENHNTRLMSNNIMWGENRAAYEMWGEKKTVQPAGHRWQYGACALHAGYLRLQTHSEYVMLTAFPLQQRLHERVSVFCHTYIACVVIRACRTNAKG